MSSASGRKKWRCPGCGRSFSIPSAASLNLCPDCKKRTNPPIVIASNATPIAPAFSSFNFEEADHETEADPVISSPVAPTQSSSADGRYPNLKHYLASLKWTATLQLTIAIIITVILSLLSILGGLKILLLEASPQGLIAVVFGPIFFAIVIFGPAWILYVILMAIAEFIRVIVDIEWNTRNGSQHLSLFRNLKSD